MEKFKKFLFGASLVGGLTVGASSCQNKDKDDKDTETAKTEVEIKNQEDDKYGNIALFEACRSDVKFALAFVENHYDYVYWCGEAWTTADGLTILYNADGSYKKVTKDTKVPNFDEADVYKGRYMTFEILPDIENCITVPMDKETLITACILRYCIGHTNFKNSSFVKQLNAGKNGADLAKTLTGWRQQQGVPNRLYFFAALMSGKMQYSDLLNLRAEGCYNLTWKDIFVYSENNKPKQDANGFYEWDFSNIINNLEKAKQPRQVKLKLEKVKDGKTVNIDCKLVKEIVPEYVLNDVVKHSKSGDEKQTNTIDFIDAEKSYACDCQNDTSFIAYKNGDYKKALKAGQMALKSAQSNKQFASAHYNIGRANLGLENYNRAKKCFEKSLTYNETDAAKKHLQLAQEKIDVTHQKNQKKRRNAGKIALFASAGLGLAYGGRKHYLAQQQKKRYGKSGR